MTLATFTLIHTAISLLALLAGIPVVAALLSNRIARPWTAVFLVLAIATTVTGFLFPLSGLTPALITGIVASVVFLALLLARYGMHLAGAGRWLYAIAMVISLYLLVFVTIAQAFGKIPFLQPLAPGGAGPVFAIVQLVVLLGFVAIGFLAVRRFRPAAV